MIGRLKRLWPKRLAGQMIALLLLALVLAQLVTLMIFADERRFAIRAADRSQLLGRAVSVVRLLENSPDTLHQQILETASDPKMRYWLSTASAVDIDHDDRHRDRFIGRRLAELLDERAQREVRVEFDDDDDHDWRGWWREDDRRESHRQRRHWPLSVLISMQLKDGRWLNLESGLSPPIFGWKLPALTWLGLMALTLSAVVIIMIRRITKPMAALAGAAERAGRGEAIEPLPEVGPIDVRQTTAAFNNMHERLQRFVKDRTRMLAAMSHDLRTPITTLRLRAEFIEDEEIKGKILETLEDMQRMTEATLAFVREEAAVEPTRLVDLTALIESIASDLADLGHDVVFNSTERVVYACRPSSIKRALSNLIENAIRYGDKASVELSETNDMTIIVIDDEGPGISEEQVERMFEPFVRLDESRNEETGGIGLGLAIARSIVRSHGGEIELSNRKAGGLRATISLPKAEKGAV
ncbi:MAG: ATP-binding protein [Geminicoccaceae bacterium]